MCERKGMGRWGHFIRYGSIVIVLFLTYGMLPYVMAATGSGTNDGDDCCAILCFSATALFFDLVRALIVIAFFMIAVIVLIVMVAGLVLLSALLLRKDR